MRATQFSILAALALKGSSPIGALAELLGLERTTLTRSAALPQGHGWVETAPSQDGREHRLRLTPAGRRKLEEAFPAWREVQVEVWRKACPLSLPPVTGPTSP